MIAVSAGAIAGVRGLRVIVGIAVGPDGTLLVSDENPVEGRWGQLFRFDFDTRQSSLVSTFRGDSVPTSIDFDRSPARWLVHQRKSTG
jgi:hypothetical protein